MGAKSYPFLGVIGRELARLLPKSKTIVFPDAGHQMWLQASAVRKAMTSAGLAGVRRRALPDRYYRFLTNHGNASTAGC